MDDDKMTDDTLSTLKLLRTSAPSAESKKLALNAAMLAFDAAQPKATSAKRGWLNRWTLGAGLGVPLGTAVAALVLLPLGTQLYTATSHRIDGVPPKKDISIATTEMPPHQDEAESKTRSVVAATTPTSGPTTLGLQKPQPVMEKPTVPADADAGRAAPQGTIVTEENMPQTGNVVTMEAAPPAPVPMARDMRSTTAPKLAAAQPANATAVGGMVSPTSVVPYQPSGDTFQKFDENRTKVVKTDPVSTFSIDVDTASYSYVRGVLKDRKSVV